MAKENTTDEIAVTQDGSGAVEGRYQVGNKGTFDVLDSEPTWKLSSVNKFVSVSSDQLSSESISAQRKDVTLTKSALRTYWTLIIRGILSHLTVWKRLHSAVT